MSIEPSAACGQVVHQHRNSWGDGVRVEDGDVGRCSRSERSAVEFENVGGSCGEQFHEAHQIDFAFVDQFGQ